MIGKYKLELNRFYKIINFIHYLFISVAEFK